MRATKCNFFFNQYKNVCFGLNYNYNTFVTRKINYVSIDLFNINYNYKEEEKHTYKHYFCLFFYINCNLPFPLSAIHIRLRQFLFSNHPAWYEMILVALM